MAPPLAAGRTPAAAELALCDAKTDKHEIPLEYRTR